MMMRLWISVAAATLMTAVTLTAASAGGEAAQAAFGALASELGVSEGEFTLARFDDVTWADGCLGAPEPDESCDQASVDGHVVWIAVGSDAYRYHTNLDGSSLRLSAGPFSATDVDTAPLPAGSTLREPPDVPPDGLGPGATGNAGLAIDAKHSNPSVALAVAATVLLLLIAQRAPVAGRNISSPTER